jgi:hypothetical protein
MLRLREVGRAGDAARVGADERQQPGLQRALVQLDVAAELEAADHREQVLQRDALAIQQQLVAGVEDPQVAEHLALVRQERRVAAAARLQALDVVGHLALQELLGLTTGQRQLAALGAIDDRAALDHRPVRVGARVGQRHHSVSS